MTSHQKAEKQKESGAAEYGRNEYGQKWIAVTTDKARLDIGAIHDFLKSAYWCENVPYDVVRKSIEHSLCFGMFDGRRQIGFARVITDYATFAYLGDVYILDEYRGQGLAKMLMRCVMEHPELQGLLRFGLATRDAHGLYDKFGFRPLAAPDYFMEVFDPDLYRQ